MPPRLARGFPLFPLGIAAVPGESVPLHIFEPRYRVMFERCLQAQPGSLERQFGILWFSEQELKPVGCACEVERLLERTPDGRLNVLSRGTRPFRLLERQSDLPYPAGLVEFLTDAEEQVDAQAAQAARGLYGELAAQLGDRPPAGRGLAAIDAYGMAATVDFGVQAKQQLLELRSENERLRLLARLLRGTLERLQLLERTEGLARSNGKVRLE